METTYQSPSSLGEAASEAIEELRGLLKSHDLRTRIQAARTILDAKRQADMAEMQERMVRQVNDRSGGVLG